MKLDVITTRSGTVKMISNCNRKHPALVHMAKLLRESNKYAALKIGIYNVSSAEFQTHKTIYSYICDRTERMSKKKYYEWLKGEKQMKPLLWDRVFQLKGYDQDDDLDDIFGFVEDTSTIS